MHVRYSSAPIGQTIRPISDQTVRTSGIRGQGGCDPWPSPLLLFVGRPTSALTFWPRKTLIGGGTWIRTRRRFLRSEEDCLVFRTYLRFVFTGNRDLRTVY